MEIIVGGFRAVVLEIVPVEMVVVNESAVENYATMRFQSSSDHVGGVRVSTAVTGRAQAAFRVSLHDDAAEVRDHAIDLVDLGLPPGGYERIERIERIEAADHFRTAQVHRDRELDAPRTEGIGNSSNLRDEGVVENLRSCVDVVDRASIDADGSEQSRVRTGTSQVVANFALGEEDRASAVAALDASVEVVPLIDPADGSRGHLQLVNSLQALAAGNLTQ